MKLHHFALIFTVIFLGAVILTGLRLDGQRLRRKAMKQEHRTLASAVDAVVLSVYEENGTRLLPDGKFLASEVLLQTLAALHGSAPDVVGRNHERERLVALALFEERGYTIYSVRGKEGYGWSELFPYEVAKGIPEAFYVRLQKAMASYHSADLPKGISPRVERVEDGVFENELSRACVLAVYEPILPKLGGETGGALLYAASSLVREQYIVTEDGKCHIPSCELVHEDNVSYRFSSQREAAEYGAWPCTRCLTGEE